MANETGSNVTYLITGGAGFIGSHMAGELLARDHRVLAFDDLSTGSLDNIAALTGNPQFAFTQGSVTDASAVDPLAEQADIIIHLAAAVGVRLIVERPVQTIDTNVVGTEVVLAAARRHRCRVVLASTSEVYGKGNKVPFHEEDDVVLGPSTCRRWSYAASKLLDEYLALAYHAEYGLEIIIVRLFNTVGARQTGQYGMVVPRLVRQAIANASMTVYGDGMQTRCFCDVRDVVPAIIGLAECDEALGRIFNIGGTYEITIAALARNIKALAKSLSPVNLIPYDAVYPRGFEDMRRRVPDTRRIQELLGWHPRHALEATIQSVIAHEQSKQAPE